MKLTGYHVTTTENAEAIQQDGFLGSKWENDFSRSFSNPFELKADGAVFCFTTLSQAESNRGEWGDNTVIFKVEGEGVKFNHENEGEQIAIRANSIEWDGWEIVA